MSMVPHNQHQRWSMPPTLQSCDTVLYMHGKREGNAVLFELPTLTLCLTLNLVIYCI